MVSGKKRDTAAVWPFWMFGSFLDAFCSLTKGGCPPLPPPDEAMRARVLRVRVLLLLLLLLLLLRARGGLLCGYK